MFIYKIYTSSFCLLRATRVGNIKNTNKNSLKPYKNTSNIYNQVKIYMQHNKNIYIKTTIKTNEKGGTTEGTPDEKEKYSPSGRQWQKKETGKTESQSFDATNEKTLSHGMTHLIS